MDKPPVKISRDEDKGGHFVERRKKPRLHGEGAMCEDCRRLGHYCYKHLWSSLPFPERDK